MDNKIRLIALPIFLILAASACTIGTSNPNNPAVGDPPLFPAVELTIQATPSNNPLNAVGQTIQYTYNIKNSGNVPLPGVVIIDNTTVTCPAVNTIGNLDDYLDVNEILICTSTYTIAQSDLDKGSVTSVTTANVNGTLSAPVTSSVPTVPNRILTLTKTAIPTTYDRLGQTITYSYVVTNTGTIAIGPAQFSVTDTGVSAPINCGNVDVTLAPNATVTCTYTYIITQADMDAASVATNATASGGGVGPSQPVTATVTKGAVSNLTPGTTIQHTVVEGEWLWQIARCYGADPNVVIQANRQLPNPAMIKAGTIVSVPNIGSKGTIYGPPCVVTYTVQANDTWNSIGQKPDFNADPGLLQQVNLGVLSAGRVIKVPRNSFGANITNPTTTPNNPIPPTTSCVDVIRSLKLANINPNTTHFTICGAMDSQAKMKIATIRVYQRPEDVGLGGLLQDITLPASIETSTAVYDASSLIVGDMNYDGNDDFRVVKFLPASPNIPYVYYLYDPASRTFVYNEAYGKITSPEFPGNNEIRSQWRESAAKWGIDTYVVNNNNPVLTRRETWEAINDTQAKHQVFTFNADGTSVLTLDEVVPLPAQ